MLELLVVALLDEADELDQALGLVRRRLGQRPVWAAVFLPVVAEEVEAAESLRPHKQALLGVESIRQERPVHGLDEGVKPEISLVVFARDGERHLGQSRARRGNAGLAEKGEGERLPRLRRVECTALELDRAKPVEISMIGRVQLDHERTLQAPGRRHVGGVPRVAEADALVRLPLDRDVPARPAELDAEEVPFACPLPGLPRTTGRRWSARSRRPGQGAAWPRYSSAGISMWSFTTLVRPKRSAPAAFLFASPSSAARRVRHRGPARKGSGAAQRGCHGEGSSTHGVTSREMDEDRLVRTPGR